jgi:hypothetical protein
MIAGVFFILLALLLLVVLSFSMWSSLRALRVGSFTNRNGLQVSKVENPFVFWISVSLGLGVPAIVLCAVLLTAIWLLVAALGKHGA